MDTQLITYYATPCLSCAGKGCNWCQGEPLVLPTLGGLYVCYSESRHPDMDGVTASFYCERIAEVRLKVSYLDEFDPATAHVFFTHFCTEHVTAEVEGTIDNDGSIIGVEVDLDGWAAQGQPYLG